MSENTPEAPVEAPVEAPEPAPEPAVEPVTEPAVESTPEQPADPPPLPAGAATYTGDEGRYYPALGITPEPGRAYELPAIPDDGKWAAPTSKE